ncbi:MAG: restriction endonuclease subunit S [Oscillospiraceae bacterium]|nr:restriction endonuclease subunit S [Oscillospiraceae bacterium]
MNNNILHSISWSDYTIGQLFVIKKGKRLRREDMSYGTTNYIGAIKENNGIRQLIDHEPIFKPNCLTVNYNGSVGEVFYQSESFWASDDVNILYSKGWILNKYIGLFIATVIKANKYRFGYGRKWTIDKMKESIISLPSSADGNPNFQFMEQYIKSLNHNPITTAINQTKILPLDIKEWGEFLLGDLFRIKRGNRIIKNEDYFESSDESHCYKVITASAMNNGVDGYFDRWNCSAGTLVCGGEAAGMFATYQPDRCWVLDSSRIFVPLEGVKINVYVGMFLSAVFRKNQYRFSYGRKANPDKIEKLIVKLPVTLQGTPDWHYMEQYIKSLPYSDRI